MYNKDISHFTKNKQMLQSCEKKNIFDSARILKVINQLRIEKKEIMFMNHLV